MGNPFSCSLLVWNTLNIPNIHIYVCVLKNAEQTQGSFPQRKYTQVQNPYLNFYHKFQFARWGRYVHASLYSWVKRIFWCFRNCLNFLSEYQQTLRPFAFQTLTSAKSTRRATGSHSMKACRATTGCSRSHNDISSSIRRNPRSTQKCGVRNMSSLLKPTAV